MTGPVSRLPEVVDLMPGARLYSSKSRIAVRQLAMDLLNIPTEGYAAVAATMLDKGMMVSSQWGVRIALWIARKRGLSEFDFWMAYYKKKPEEAAHLLGQASVHIVDGKDREEPGSVGGMSQREINVIANLIALTTGAYQAEMDKIAQQNEMN